MQLADRVIETVLTVCFWMFQIGITVGIALLIGWLFKTLEGAFRRRRGHLLPWTLCVFVALCAVLAALAMNPPVVCPDECEDHLTPEIHSAVQAVSRGLYSDRLPLVPAFSRINDITKYEKSGETEYEIHFDINYLYFGQRGMFWSSVDGYEQVKQLFGY